MNAEEARRIAHATSPTDPIQAKITEAALRMADDGRLVTIVEVAPDDWRVRFLGEEDDLGFGPAAYGGTMEEAEQDAARVASKWGWTYLPPELQLDADGSIIYTPPPVGPGAGARAAEALRIAYWVVAGGDRGPIKLAKAGAH
jgi:hypothetical protein